MKYQNKKTVRRPDTKTFFSHLSRISWIVFGVVSADDSMKHNYSLGDGSIEGRSEDKT